MKTTTLTCKMICFIVLMSANFSVLAQSSPGGVSTGIGLWIKADTNVYSDAGVTLATNGNSIQQWNDLTVNGNHFTQPNPEKPTYLENSLNFNPQVFFDGTQAMDGISTTGLPSGSDARFMRLVTTQTAAFTGNHVPFAHGTEAQDQAHIIAGSSVNNSLIYGSWEAVNDISSSNFWTLNQPHIIGGGFDGISTSFLQADGATLTTDTDGAPPTWNTVNSRMRIGADMALITGQFWTGNIAEIIVYNADVSAINQQKIDSYLALKYGITLDQTVATNYFNSSGTIIWDATINGGFENDIFGIGEDTGSALNQKVSRSANNTNGPILATTQHFTQANNDALRTVSLGNGNFMVMGHNNGADNSFTSSFDGGTNNRSDRVWKVDETGTVGNVYFAIPKSNYTFPTGTPSLVVSNDTTFNASDTIVSLSDDGTYFWAIINPTDNQYLVLASISTLTLEDKNILNFTLYPNPAKNVVNLKFNSATSSILDIRIYNILGSLILTERADVQSNIVTINIASLKSGVYFLNIKDKNKETSKKLIIE